jgi:hypothetical protein
MTVKSEFHYFGTETQDGTKQGYFFKVSRESSGAGDDYQEEVGIEEIWIVNQVNGKEIKSVMKLPAILDAIVEGNCQLTGPALHAMIKMFEDTRGSMEDMEPIIDPFIDAIERANLEHPQDFDHVIEEAIKRSVK